MSVVAVKVEKDKITISADTQVTYGDNSKRNNFSKLFKANDMVIGSVGQASEMGLMVHYMQTHKPLNDDIKSMLEFIVEFSKWKKDFANCSEICNSYIIIFKRKAFLVEGTFVEDIKDSYAIGSGASYANAVLYLKHTTQEACKVAAALNCFVGEPIETETVFINKSLII